jgi:hypothetical protein
MEQENNTTDITNLIPLYFHRYNKDMSIFIIELTIIPSNIDAHMAKLNKFLIFFNC